MMTNKKYGQTSPDKANELFTKLLDTSNNAVKLRERLFSDLKEELELSANLQEQHLFPVLRKHKEMQDLVREAINDNQETSALLAELERMPKNDSAFVGKIAELRKVFQQHIRDDKKELLPAVLKILSDEEAEAVVEKIEGELAVIEETKRAETEQRRTEAKRAQAQTESVQQVADNMADSVRAGAEGAQKVASTVRDTVQSGLGAASEIAQRSTDQALQVFSFSGRDARDLADQASQNLQAIARSGTVLARGAQDVSQQWMSMTQDRFQKSLDGLNALARCRSVPDVVALQSSLMRNNLEQMLENSRHLAELSMSIADEASRTINTRA
jgi:phasin family protein